MVQFAPGTVHYHSRAEYAKTTSWLVGAEGASNWYVKLTGGVIVGYREPYEDKIPFNHNGVAPGIVAGVGYQYDRFNAQLNVLGTSGVMFTFGYDLFR